jgi:hypothetical protein
MDLAAIRVKLVDIINCDAIGTTLAVIGKIFYLTTKSI